MANKATFLKNLGLWLARGAAVVSEVTPGLQFLAPLLGSALGGSSSKVAGVVTTGLTDFESIAGLVSQVEQVGVTAGLSGVQKMQALIPMVQNFVSTSELVAGKKVADEQTFNKGCAGIAQGIVDVLNGIHPNAAPNPTN